MLHLECCCCMIKCASCSLIPHLYSQVNTGDRYAARKDLMQAFRSHLEDFRGGGCSPCCQKQLVEEDTSAVEMDEMMRTKFRRSRRHSAVAFLTLMGLLLLAFVYADNTKWGDTWFRTPTYYNITELLEGGGDDVGSGKSNNNKIVEEENQTGGKTNKTKAKEGKKESDEKNGDKGSKTRKLQPAHFNKRGLREINVTQIK